MPEIKIRVVGPANCGKSIIAREIVEHLKRRGVHAVTVDESVQLDGGGLYAVADNLHVEVSEVVMPKK